MSSKFELALAAAEAAATAAALAVEDSDAATRNSILAEYNELEVRAALAADGASSPATDAAVALAVRYKKDPLTGCCRIPGCKVQLVSRRLKYLWPFKPFIDKENKHHCRSCKLKVCAAHFTRSQQGMKVCTACLAAGVDGPDLGKGEGEEEEEDAEEREAVAGGAAAPPSPAATPAAQGGGGGTEPTTPTGSKAI
jgi:hypothetical protein